MIINSNTNPKNQIYYLGALVIDIVRKQSDNVIDFLLVFEELNAVNKTSVNLYVITLDWLFIIGVLKTNHKGDIIKCF
jgi:hypothetical protein